MAGNPDQHTGPAPEGPQLAGARLGQPPSTPGWRWQSLIALLGSTGLISVFGPIVGEMYWEGFLNAFGLTSDEFPALPSRVHVYAYLAIIEAVASLWNQWMEWWWPWAIGVVGCVGALMILERIRRTKWWIDRREQLRGRLVEETLAGTAARTGISVLIASVMVSIVYALALIALSVALGPIFARSAGLRSGHLMRAEIEASAKQSPSVCDQIVGRESSGCLRVIAFSADSVAVLDGMQVRRLGRSGLDFSTALPAASVKGGTKQ